MGQARTLFKGIACLLFILFMRERTVAQNGVSDVHGTVLTTKGESLPGVAVQAIEKGSGQKFNTITDAKGDFIFRNFQVGKQYDFHCAVMGYEKNDYLNFTVENKGENLLLVRLAEKSIGLNDVVVVGYGTQKKVNLTGAVDQVDAKTFADKPVSNVAQALQGAIPNLNITFGDGHPGSTGNFNIRGYASITNASGSPLILIDGVPGNINMLNPQDIETLTVLKDAASAAIYGARGAFGVILVTTKQAKKGTLTINYGTSYSSQKNTTRTDFITDGYTQVNLADIAFSRNVGNSYTGYNADDYAELKKRQTDKSLPSVVIQNRNGQNQYVYYGSTDWWNFLFKKSQPGLEHHFSMSGGSDKADFVLSGRYYQQKGMFQEYLHQDVYNAYNFRAKINVHVAPWLTVYSNTQFGANDYTFPGYNQNMTGLYNHAMASYVPKNPDGTFAFRTNLNNYGAYEYADLQNGKSHGGVKNYNFTNTVGFSATVAKGLTLAGNYAFQLDPYSDYQRTAFIPWSINPGIINKTGNDQLTENTHLDQHHSVNLFATYEKSHGKHNFKGVAGYNMELQKFKYNQVARQNLLSDDLNQIDLGTGAMTVKGNASEWALLGYFARVNYDYEGKYLLEMNGRYDGSSRFPAGQRYGFFPSISGGWRVSEERFFSGIKSVMNELKLRASYGSLGNQELGNQNVYPYVPVMTSTLSKWIINGNQTQTLSAPAPVTPHFTWEKSASTNGGIDAAFLKNRLLVSYDWYRRKTTDMLIPGKTLPSVFGASSPLQNAGDLLTKGFEVSVKWQDHGKLAGKPFSYSVGAVLSDYKATITKFDNPDQLLSSHYVGEQLGEIWGYSIDGFFKTQVEADSRDINQDYVDRDQRLTSPGEWSKLHPGDLKFKDLNGDKIVNEGKNTLGDHGDLRRIGNTLPRYSFGFNASFNWSNFDLAVAFQGIGKQNWYPNVESSKFWGPYGRPYASFIPKNFEKDIWSETNPNAYYPLLRGYAAYPGGELSVNNDKYLQNLAYIRLKNLTIGYNLPVTLTKRFKIQKLRLYFTGQNLLTFTKMKTKYIDPEQVSPSANDAGGRDYPFFKQYSGGFDITF